MVMERLGITYIEAVINISGGCVISSITLSDVQLGYLTSINLVTIGNRRYSFTFDVYNLLLNCRHVLLNGPVPHASLVLPYLLEMVGEELKSVVGNTSILSYY